MITEIRTCDFARIPVMWLVTHEEGKAEEQIKAFAKQHNRPVLIWSSTSDNGTPGWEASFTSTQESILKTKARDFTESPRAAHPATAISDLCQKAVKAAESIPSSATVEEEASTGMICIIRDPSAYLKDHRFVRALRDANASLKMSYTSIVCISPKADLPVELEVDVEIIRPGLPTSEELQSIVVAMMKDIPSESYLDKDGELDKSLIETITNACCGLTASQAADAIAKSNILHGEIVPSLIHKIKTQSVNETPSLTYIENVPKFESLGGLDGLKVWIEERGEGFSQKARDFGLPTPKGVLVTGISGAGKSLFAKVVSSYLNLPLIKFNPAEMRNRYVGGTEENIIRVQNKLNSIGNHVLWIDELEKSLPKAGDRSSDGGSSDALLQSILHWLQERPGGSFVVATSNDVSMLNPELLRKGRWDAIFFVDLPNETERQQIYRIHLEKFNRKFPDKEIELLSKSSEGRSGAEIEASVIDGLWKAFSEQREIICADIIEKLNEEKPLSEMMREQIEAQRSWAKANARLANSKESAESKDIVQKKKPRRFTLEGLSIDKE